jgi:hypothetical protein
MSDAQFIVQDITSIDDIKLMEKAKIVGDILNEHYPCHLWLVCWQGGALVVKNLALGSHYGFIMRDDPDYVVLAHNAMIAGGELLERARMKRGKWDGEMPTHLDGADPRIWKPLH